MTGLTVVLRLVGLQSLMKSGSECAQFRHQQRKHTKGIWPYSRGPPHSHILSLDHVMVISQMHKTPLLMDEGQKCQVYKDFDYTAD